MVHVGVGEDDGVDFLGVDHDVAVGGVGFEALALEHAAVQQYFLAVVGGDEVLAARHFLGRTDEFDFHIAILKFAPKVGKIHEIANHFDRVSHNCSRNFNQILLDFIIRWWISNDIIDFFRIINILKIG